MRKITRIKGGEVRIRLRDWARFLDAAFPAGRGVESAGGNGCQGFCDAVCESHEGCRAAFGEEPECGAICEDLEVFLQA